MISINEMIKEEFDRLKEEKTTSNDKELNYLDGELIATNSTQTFTCVNPLYIFAMNNNGSSSSNAYIKLFDYQVWDNTTLTRYFKPFLRNGVAGLLDTVNNVFYTNQGTGTFNFKIKERK